MKIKNTKNIQFNKTKTINEIELIYKLLIDYKNIYKECDDILIKIKNILKQEVHSFQKEDILYDLTDYELSLIITLCTNKLLTLKKSMIKYKQCNLCFLNNLNCEDYYKEEILKYNELNKILIEYNLIKDNQVDNSNEINKYITKRKIIFVNNIKKGVKS